MSKLMFKNISFFLINFSILRFCLALLNKYSEKITFIEWELSSGIQNLTWTFFLDFKALLFLCAVLFISRNVVWYSQRYLYRDPNKNRFILLVLGFVASICLLITRSNIITILLGWDGLGLISYCLVIYYPTKKSSRAGILTVLSNRVGDICILLLVGWFSLIGDYNFLILSQASTFLNSLDWIYLLVILGAITKSAQIPFSAWLPAAIAAPTPVSALVHSSTLVTAGVYLLIRFSHFSSDKFNLCLIVTASLTMFISGLVAFFEYDLKKIIALSTLSQLGVIIFAISINLPEVALFHLITHALFKALLFLCAGVIIHGNQNSQDIRSYGSLILNFPLVGVCLNLANLSLCGLPFLSGFYSKDIIIELAAQNSWNSFIIIIAFSALGLTVAYSVRLVYFTIISFSNTPASLNLCDSDYTLVGPILNLTFLSLLSGPSLSWVIFPSPRLILLPYQLKFLALFIIFLSCVTALSLVSPSLNFTLNTFMKTLNSRIWFLPILRGQSTSKFFIPWGNIIIKNLDAGWFEELSKQEAAHNSRKFRHLTNFIQLNRLKRQFLFYFILICILFVLFICLYSLKLKHNTEAVKIRLFFKGNH